MKKNFFILHLILLTLIFTPFSNSQSLSGMEGADKDFFDSLPDSVKDDVLSEMKGSLDEDINVKKRPSSKLSKLEVVKNWENFKKKQLQEIESERYGRKLFNSMQSSFMPLNEPNFGNNYVVDSGDYISIQTYGNIKNETSIIEIGRDGTITLDDIGKVSLAGLNFEQVTDIIQKKYASSSIGVNVIVTLSEIRDINILITGNVDFPGIYTLSGNSNILQALDIVGGVSENGSLRKITLKRKGKSDINVDLYSALMFGDITNIPFLMSGDSIHIEPVQNLVRAGYGFNNAAIFELNDGEKIADLIKFAGGLKKEVNNNSLKLVRFEDNKFNTYDISFDEANDLQIKNLDSIYAFKENIGTVTITGNVAYPGKYSVSSSDKILDLIERSGGYTDPAYPFAGTLLRSSVIEVEKTFIEKAYRDLIKFIAGKPSQLGQGGQGLAYLLEEIKNHEPIGRVITEFDIGNLKDFPQDNIYLNHGDKIHIPTYSSNVFVFGEVGNPGSVAYRDNKTLKDFIKSSGGTTRYAAEDNIFIVSPNCETTKVHISGLKRLLKQDYEIYPGSVIYVPRDVGKIEGINLYATAAPIFSSLALSIASLNSINN